MAEHCNWKLRLDYENARKQLTSYSEKPKGHCFAQNSVNIMYDLQIVVPAYNVEKFIEKCLDSIEPLLNSKYKVLLQIIDDGSVDKTGELADSFSQKIIENVTVIHQKNAGLSNARNTAIQSIVGEYIMFVDSDDYLPESINIDYIFECIKGKDVAQGTWRIVDTKNRVIEEINSNVFSGFAWGKIFRYSVFQNLMFPEGYWFEDSIVRLIISRMHLNTVVIDECVYCHRDNPNGIARTARNHPKAVDSYWITELCLEETKAFGIENDQISFDLFLHQSIINQIRVMRLPIKIRKAIFVLTSEMVERHFKGFKSDKYLDIENAIRNVEFYRFELLALGRWCSI